MATALSESLRCGIMRPAGGGRMGIAIACCLVAWMHTVHAAEVVDMAGRSVVVPTVVQRITCIHSTPSHMVWRLAPSKLASIDSQFKDRLQLIPASEVNRLLGLPLTGIYRGGINREEMLALRPDIILSLTKDPGLDQEQRDFAAPVFAISKDSLADYATSLRLVGRLVGNEAEGNMLADYWEETMGRVAALTSSIPEEVRPRVYYAQRKTTSTVGSATIMASIIRLAGGRSFLDGMHGSLAQKESEGVAIPLEDVIAWDPDVIIAASSSARDEILADPRWKSMRAVKEGRVHAVLKLAMLDRMQSLMGLLWTANLLQPGRAAFDLLAEGRRFYGLMNLNGTISSEQMQEGL